MGSTAQPNVDLPKNKFLLIKKIHNFFLIITKLSQNECAHEFLVLSVIHNNWVKIVDF